MSFKFVPAMLHVKRLVAGLALLLATVGAAVAGDSFTVPVTAFVIDGDTFRLDDGRSVRLVGIDAPECEPGQRLKGQCDRAETGMLVVMLGHGPAVCAHLGFDHYNRVLGRCQVRGDDIARRLVFAGLARAVRWNGRRLVYGAGDYLEAELAAIRAGRGYWQCRAVTPPRFADIKSGRCPAA